MFGKHPGRHLLTSAEEGRIVAAIRRAEARSSGEIRVVVVTRCPGDALEAAHAAFDALGMRHTLDRSGVLLYIAASDRKFAVAGDRGIHERVPDGFWDAVRDRVRERFRSGAFAAGIEEAVDAIGAELARAFPKGPADRNELPDSIVYGDT